MTWATDRTGSESDAGILAFTRTDGGKSVLVVTNVDNTQTSQTDFAGTQMKVPFPVGTRLVEVLGDPLDTTKRRPIWCQRRERSRCGCRRGRPKRA